MVSRSYLINIVLAIGEAFSALSSAQTPTAERSTLQIDWEAVRQSQQEALARGGARLQQMRSALSASGLDQVSLPVLLPATIEELPRFQHQAQSYVAVYVLTRAKLSILGSATALSLSNNSPLAPLLRGADAQYRFETAEDGADLSFSRFGASYTLRLTCENIRDERCLEQTFLRAIAESLVAVGGQQRPASR